MIKYDSPIPVIRDLAIHHAASIGVIAVEKLAMIGKSGSFVARDKDGKIFTNYHRRDNSFFPFGYDCGAVLKACVAVGAITRKEFMAHQVAAKEALAAGARRDKKITLLRYADKFGIGKQVRQLLKKSPRK